jgi:hypothetical protein
MMFLGIGSSVVVVDFLIADLPSYVLAAALWALAQTRVCDFAKNPFQPAT